LVDLEGRDRLLDADAVARDLNPISPSAASIAAGREILRRTADYLNQGVSFAIETTLSSRGRLEMMRKAKFCGYRVNLLFIGVDSPERCIWRIRNRAMLGGHFVPAADVRRRYARSTANIAEALRLADRARVYDNSGNRHRLVLVAKAGQIAWRAQPIPEWLKV
jgi:predicted ABC-type ATPase